MGMRWEQVEDGNNEPDPLIEDFSVRFDGEKWIVEWCWVRKLPNPEDLVPIKTFSWWEQMMEFNKKGG